MDRFRSADDHFQVVLSFSSANVTGQRTRHLVAGTLDPIVGSFIIHSYACQYIVDHVRAIPFECRVDV